MGLKIRYWTGKQGIYSPSVQRLHKLPHLSALVPDAMALGRQLTALSSVQVIHSPFSPQSAQIPSASCTRAGCNGTGLAAPYALLLCKEFTHHVVHKAHKLPQPTALVTDALVLGQQLPALLLHGGDALGLVTSHLQKCSMAKINGCTA